MAKADFLLQKCDQKRFFKDRLVRVAVSLGGVSVLAALIGLFVYLGMMVFPLFQGAKLLPNQAQITITTTKPVFIGLDDRAELAYSVAQTGQVDIWSLLPSMSSSPLLESFPLFASQLTGNAGVKSQPEPLLFAREPAALRWLAAATPQGQLEIFKLQLEAYQEPQAHDIQQGTLKPKLVKYPAAAALALSGRASPLQQFVFSVSAELPTVVGYFADQRVVVKWLDMQQQSHQFVFPERFSKLDQMLLTPDGDTLYLRSGSELAVAQRQGDAFTVREVVDLSAGIASHQAVSMTLLSGAYSLLVTHNDQSVTQWFDVLEQQQRHLRQIRAFELTFAPSLLLEGRHQKGFYTFSEQGDMRGFYTTSEKQSHFPAVNAKSPQQAALSDNERFLLTFIADESAEPAVSGAQTAVTGQLHVAELENVHPEVSFSSLWQKVWYESYPEPRYVWQTSAASADTEEKFSLAPIAFGTLKATVYVMLFAVPLAICGAIYTAYFMSPRLRRVVKPTIELMEALPTVIIGFLAGLWFAPMVETHLTAVFMLLITLPLFMIGFGALYHGLPSRWTKRLPAGWHAVVLMPLLVLVVWSVMSYSDGLEALFFQGDVHLFLAQYGLDYDQRNSLVVGLAMGFAVIPTIFTIAEDAIFSVPKHLSDGSLALGATPWQTLIHVVLLTASPGIFSAIMMGLGRAAGETMIVLMATGNTPIMDWNILEGMRTLAATIAVEMPESEMGSSHFRVLFLAALLLLTLTFIANTVAEWVRQRLREKYRAL